MYLNGTTSRRLIFRELNTSDIIKWVRFFENNPNLPFLGLDLSLAKEEQARHWIERQLWRYENNKFGHHALIHRKTKEFIGQAGLLSQEIKGEAEIEIAYHIMPEYWGNGYATEAAMKCRDYAFEKDVCNSLISVIDIQNLASQKVAEKIGMKKECQIGLYGLQTYIYRIKK
jgi:[ribosomal protein S5]-alanine N-acetyltransferase